MLEYITRHSNKIRFFGLIIEFFVLIIMGIFKQYQQDYLWLNILFDIYTPFLIYLLIYTQKAELKNNNIDYLSIFILLLLRTYSFTNVYSSFQKTTIIVVNILLALLFIVFIYKLKDEYKPRFSPNQILLLFSGLIIGIGIASLKIFFSKPEIFTLVSVYPKYYFLSIINGFSLSTISEEFIFRGFLWKYLMDKGLSKKWIIFATSFIWAILHLPQYPHFTELINIAILGVIFGFLVYKAKSLEISIGAHVGYNSFLIFQSLLVSSIVN